MCSAVTDLVAAMDVDFDNGMIANGNLQVEVAGSEVWSVGFDGMVQGGTVDLTAANGQLIQAGTLVSDAIEADLGGVFTGAGGEAFVGGFGMQDGIGFGNSVNGLYTIER